MNWEKAQERIGLYEGAFPSVEHSVLSVRKKYTRDKPVSFLFDINEINKALLQFSGSRFTKSEDEKGVPFFNNQYACEVMDFLWVIDTQGVPMNVYSWVSEYDTKTVLDVLLESTPIRSIAYLILVTFSGWCKHKPEEHYEVEIVESKNTLVSSEIHTNIIRLPDDEEEFFEYLDRMEEERRETVPQVEVFEERRLKVGEYVTLFQPTLYSTFRSNGISPILFNVEDETWN